MTSTPSAPRPQAYRELLTPSPGLWVAALLISASLALTVLVLLGFVGTGLLALVLVALAAWALRASSARVEVDGGVLRAGRARIPVSLLGRVAVVDPERMSALRGAGGDRRAYLCQRSWIPGGVVVAIDDPQDPVPYWLISSRTPERLAAALQSACGEPSVPRAATPADGSP